MYQGLGRGRATNINRSRYCVNQGYYMARLDAANGVPWNEDIPATGTGIGQSNIGSPGTAGTGINIGGRGIEFRRRRQWQGWEDAILLEAYQQAQYNVAQIDWNALEPQLPGRTVAACQTRLRRLGPPIPRNEDPPPPPRNEDPPIPPPPPPPPRNEDPPPPPPPPPPNPPAPPNPTFGGHSIQFHFLDRPPEAFQIAGQAMIDCFYDLIKAAFSG